jgi:hypothetical protein
MLMAKVLFDKKIQRIKIGDAVSKDIKVTSGFPQRSHLVTIVFHLVCQQNIGEFRFQDCMKIQSDVNKLSEWCSLALINVKL